MNIDFNGNGGGGAGADGKSAYQIAVDNGFVGTEQEWLASLVGPEGPKVKLQEKNYTITQNGDTPIAPDPEFDGIFQGTITTNVQPLLQEKTVEITGNGTTTIVPEQGYYGISKVVANTKVTSTGSALDITGTGWENGEAVFPVALNRTASLNDDIEYTRTKFAEWNPSGTSLFGKYQNDKNLVYAPKISTAQVTDISGCFQDCSSLTTIPQLDTSKVTDMGYCFKGCSSLTTIPLLDTSAVTNMYGCFSDCNSLTTIPQLNTGAVTDMSYCFKGCSSLTTIPLLDTSAVTNMSYCFQNCSSLTDLGGFTGLKVSLELAYYGSSYPLTKQSLLNVIAGLGNADPSFEASPILTLGSTNLAKLTPEEIAVGTAKGWQIVA